MSADPHFSSRSNNLEQQQQLETTDADTGPEQIVVAKESCNFLERLPAEVRLQIYKLVLPAQTFFSFRHVYLASTLALLSTCKLINQEAYPIFLSANNFDLDDVLSLSLPSTHAFFTHVREATVEWTTKSRQPTEETSHRKIGRLNATRISDLYKYSNLQTIHIECLFWNPSDDRDYMYLRRHFREDGAVHTYLELTGLDTFWSIPRINKITFHHYKGRKETEDLMVVGEYMTTHLADHRTDSHHPIFSKRQVLSRLMKVFEGEDGDTDISEDETYL